MTAHIGEVPVMFFHFIHLCHSIHIHEFSFIIICPSLQGVTSICAPVLTLPILKYPRSARQACHLFLSPTQLFFLICVYHLWRLLYVCKCCM